MLRSVKALAKPIFMEGLAQAVNWRWKNRHKARAHSLPAPLIVSLTSYPKRYDVLGATLKTLLSQSVKPDAVILWLAHNDLAALPADVRALEQHGLSIRGTEDLRSYKKIIPALIAYPDVFIVTADDDVYYPHGWLEAFCKAYVPGDPTVLAHRAHRMILHGDRLAPYDQWTFEIADHAPRWDVFFTGVGGVFYPPGTLPPETLDVAKLQELCPFADDVWLNWMIRRNGAKARKIGPKRRFYEWPGSQGVALQNTNRGSGDGNDRQIEKIVTAFGLPGLTASPGKQEPAGRARRDFL